VGPAAAQPDGSIQRSAYPLPGTVGALLPAVVHPPILPLPLLERVEPFRSERARSVGWAIAACVAAPTETLRRLGPFDPGQFMFYEDMDLCLRARAAGIPRCSSRRSASATSAATRPAPSTTATRTTCWRGGGARSWAPTGGSPRSRSTTSAQALTFATRAAGRLVLGRRADREARPGRCRLARTGTMTRMSIRQLKASDRDAFLEMVHSSRDLHRPWAYPPERADQFDELLSRCARDDFACFIVIDDETGGIAGVFNISQIVRGSFQSAFLGYYGSARYAGKG
jgi:hypothetical protein